MSMDSPQLLILGLLAVVVCTGHLCVGFWAGRRFGPECSKLIEPGAPRPDLPRLPGFLDDVLELVEKSQSLCLQLSEHVREVPERVIVAAERLLQMSQKVDRGLRIDSHPELPAPKTAIAQTVADIAARPAEYNSVLSIRSGAFPHVPMLDHSELSILVGPEADESASSLARRNYSVPQFIAFMEGELPDASAFEKVQCNDISEAGISFYLNRRPDTEKLVITIGVAPQLVFMLVKVASYRPAFAHGQRCMRVGCQFTRRLPSGVFHWNEELGTIEQVEVTSEGTV